MKAVQINHYGKNDVVVVNTNAPMPLLSPGHVLVEVHAAGVNPIDWKIREGYLKLRRSLKFPTTLGMDFSGVIIQVAKDVASFKSGDHVYGTVNFFNGGTGSFAEYLTVNVNHVFRKPEPINHITAAAIPLVGVSAWQALIEHMNISKNDKILIHGGAGGIGSIAIQLAKHLGARVTTTVNTHHKQYVKNLGADEIIDYSSQSFENLFHDFDFVYDTVGGEVYKKSFSVVKRSGMIVSMVEPPNTELVRKYALKVIGQLTQINSMHLKKLRGAIDKHIIKINIDKIFPLEKVKEALDYQKNHHPRGKVVVRVKE